jgi:hypothetical protein
MREIQLVGSSDDGNDAGDLFGLSGSFMEGSMPVVDLLAMNWLLIWFESCRTSWWDTRQKLNS